MGKEFDHSKYKDWIDPGAVTPYERNAKKHDDKQIANIANSIQRFGWQQDTVITTDRVLVIGHGRRLAAIKLGCEMPYHVIDKTADQLTDEDIRELRIADNQTNAETGFDWELLAADTADLTFEGFNFDFVQPGGGADNYDITEDEPPVAPDTAIAQRGQIWQLGRHRLMCGDSTSPEDVAALMDGQTARLLLTDPPYNVDVGNCDRPNSRFNGVGIQNDNMDAETFISFLTEALKNADEHMDPGAGWYMFYAGLHHIEFESAVKNIQDFKLHEQLIWVKAHFNLGRNCDYQWRHECCLYGWKEGKPHYFTDSRAETSVIEDEEIRLSTLKKEELIELCARLRGENKSTTILRAEKPSSAELHPTMKPQSLLAPLIRNSSQPGWNVLDLFGGSGSTMIACEQMERNCFIMELDPHYADVIVQRWEKFTGEKAVLLNG